PNRTVLDRLEDVIAQNHNRVALISDHETLSFGEMGARINRIARWAKANGIQKGDSVALFLPNRPDYLCIWLGIARAGGATALLNTSQTSLRSSRMICLRSIITPWTMCPMRRAFSFTTFRSLNLIARCNVSLTQHLNRMNVSR
ncbi:MAG: hypothetical protein EBU00_06845, partial [Alphaproteobacteria bacterium]|nr:hypothetical protein [Alphaproteobacteria bacterium]